VKVCGCDGVPEVGSSVFPLPHDKPLLNENANDRTPIFNKKKSNRKIKLLSKILRIIVAIQEANYN
jgi:hypothetical protein